jgi:hypothetical protein
MRGRQDILRLDRYLLRRMVRSQDSPPWCIKSGIGRDCVFWDGGLSLYYRKSMGCLISPLSVLNPTAASASFCV